MEVNGKNIGGIVCEGGAWGGSNAEVIISCVLTHWDGPVDCGAYCVREILFI